MNTTKNVLIYLSCTVSLFLGVNVLHAMNYMIGVDTAPTLQKVFPSLLMMILTLILAALSKDLKKTYNEKKIEVHFLFFCISILAFIIYSKAEGAISFIPNTLILPILFSLCINDNDYIFSKKIKSLVLLFFIINCCIAIIERIKTTHLFASEIENLDFFGFRSTALQDHPLNNALITSTIMIFILFSNMNITKKYLLYFIGYFSIICYGSRSSILISTVVIIIYFLQSLFAPSKSYKKFISIVFMISGSMAVLYSLIYTSIGERLINKLYFDESANVRLNLFDIFDMIDMNNLLWGTSNEAIEKFTSEIGISTIENFWVGWIIRFGIIISPILIIFFIKFILKRLSGYSRVDRTIISLALLAIASTNNSLTSNTTAISIFVMCSFCFSHKQNYILRRIRHPHESLPVKNEIMIETNLSIAI